MKKKTHLALAAFLAAIVGSAAAQQWHTANEVTLAWDPVEKIAPTDRIMYQVYIKPQGSTSMTAAGVETEATRARVSFQEEGRYFLCVQALRYPEGEQPLTRSEISCSDNPAVVLDGQTFGVVYYLAPSAPSRLRLGGP